MAPNADIAEKDHLWMGTNYNGVHRRCSKSLGNLEILLFILLLLPHNVRLK